MRPRHATCALATIVLLAAAACGGSTLPAASAPATASPSPAATSAAPSTDDPQALLERARSVHEAPGAIGVLAAGGTRTFLEDGTGDLAGATLDETSRFRIASITKPIVAALVLDAVDRGELRLDDVVGERLPGVVRDTPAVTVRQLLDHTSGIFDEGNEGDATDVQRIADPELRAEAEDLLARSLAGERVLAPDRVIVALAESHDRYFAPGDGYHYSNVNYQVAGMLLEEATGQSLADLLAERIVEPLGLTRTSLAPADTTSPELRGYVRASADATPDDVTDDLAWFGNGGNGGILSTPDELLAVLRAIVTARLFPAPLVAEMETPNRSSYGLGLASYLFRCGTFYGHGGLVNGTQSIALVSPDGDDGVVLALNLVSERDPRLTTLAETMLCGTP